MRCDAMRCAKFVPYYSVIELIFKHLRCKDSGNFCKRKIFCVKFFRFRTAISFNQFKKVFITLHFGRVCPLGSGRNRCAYSSFFIFIHLKYVKRRFPYSHKVAALLLMIVRKINKLHRPVQENHVKFSLFMTILL